MGTVPTKQSDKTELVVCPCGNSFLAYKSARKTYCSNDCKRKYRDNSHNKGKRFPRPEGWKPSPAQLKSISGLSSRVHKGRTLTPEHKEKLRESARARWNDPDYLNKMRARPAPSEDERVRISERMVERWERGVYDEHRPYYNEKSAGYHNGVWMRCLNSEGVFAREMDRAGIAWLYEPRRFRLSWCTYKPDFYLPELDVWVEVKGIMTDVSLRKIQSFREETGKTLTVVMWSELPTPYHKVGG